MGLLIPTTSRLCLQLHVIRRSARVATYNLSLSSTLFAGLTEICGESRGKASSKSARGMLVQVWASWSVHGCSVVVRTIPLPLALLRELSHLGVGLPFGYFLDPARPRLQPLTLVMIVAVAVVYSRNAALRVV